MKKRLKILLFVLIPVIIGLIVFFVIKAGWFGPILGNTEQKAAAAPKELTYSLGDFMVNLDEPGYKRYIKVKVFVGYTNSKLEAEFAEKVPQIGDAISGILRAKKLDDVNTPDKTDIVKKEIKDKINTILSTDKLINIYFKEILIQ